MIAFGIGLVLSLFHLKRRHLPANILVHFIVDFIPNVLLALPGVGS